MKRKIIFFSTILLLSLLLGACSLPWKSKHPKEGSLESNESLEQSDELTGPTLSSANLKKFKDHEEFQKFLEQANLDSQQLGTLEDLGAQNKSLEGLTIKGPTMSLHNFNNQEADIIRYEGDYMYALVYNDVYLVKINPAEQAQAVVKLSFPDRPRAIYLSNNKLIVIGADKQIRLTDVYKKFKRQSPYTFVRIYNLSNPEEANEIRTLSFEGNYLDSRLIAGNLYLFTDNYGKHEIKEPLTPRLIDGNKILTSLCDTGQKCFSPDIYYFDSVYNNYQLVSVNTLDLSTNNSTVVSQAYLLNDSQNLYIADSNFYITYAQSLDELELRAFTLKDLLFTRLSGSEQRALLDIESLNSDVFNKHEKSKKILQLMTNFIDNYDLSDKASLLQEITQALTDKFKLEINNLERTNIYRFSLGKGTPIFRAQGSVNGLGLGNFSLAEDKAANLQVLTKSHVFSESFIANKQFHSNLYTLNSNLKTISSLEKLLVNEEINSAYFYETSAFLFGGEKNEMTFLDLKNLQAPQSLGKIKIPDYYTFLSPYDDRTLIGLGAAKEVDVYGNWQNIGLKLSLLDISNPSSPTELDNYTFGANNSQSLLFSDNKSFLFNLNKNILSIPAALTNQMSSQYPYFSGALIFSINDKKISLLGKIDHSDGGKYLLADSWCGNDCYDNSVRRSFYINDYLYTFSNKYLKINRVSDLSSVQAIKLIADTEVDLSFTVPNNDPTQSESQPQPEMLIPMGPNLADSQLEEISPSPMPVEGDMPSEDLLEPEKLLDDGNEV